MYPPQKKSSPKKMSWKKLGQFRLKKSYLLSTAEGRDCLEHEVSDFDVPRRTYVYDHETNASNIQKAQNWPIGLILHYRAAWTCPRSTQKKLQHEYSVTFWGRSSALKTAIWNNRLVLTTRDNSILETFYRCFSVSRAIFVRAPHPRAKSSIVIRSLKNMTH